MRVIKIATPPEFNHDGEGSRSKKITGIIRQAIRDETPYQPVPESLIDRIAVSMPDDIALWLAKSAENAGVSLSLFTAGIIRGVLLDRARDVPAAKEKKANDDQREDRSSFLLEPLRPLYASASTCLDKGGIAFCEAYTGSGKGRMIAALALDAVDKGSVVIAAPLSVSYQILADLHHLAPQTQPTLLMGRVNFIEPESLVSDLGPLLSDRMKEWIDGGGKPLTETARAIDTYVGGGLAWLMVDAQELAADEIDLTQYALTDEDKESPAEMVYQSLRQSALFSGKIVICSHTMLAADHRLSIINPDMGSIILPGKIDTLIVDEAHQLEQAVSSVYTNSIHLDALRRHVERFARKPAIKSEALYAIRSLSEIVTSLVDAENTRSKGSIIYKGHEMELDKAILRLANALVEVIKSRRAKSRTENLHGRMIEKVTRSLQDASGSHAAIRLDLSPVQRRPSLSVGKSNLDPIMDKLWKRVGSAALVSATLYLQTIDGISARFMRSKLSVPENRACYLPVVERQSRCEQVLTRFTSIDPSIKQDDTVAVHLWHNEVADQAIDQYRTAKGGMMVLATSFATVKLLEAIISKKAHDVFLITQSESLNASACAEQFRIASKEGVKPLWLGVGSAWVGIDMSDKTVAAVDDFLLTDLYIPRIPWGLNRTMTHRRRKDRVHSAELMETLMTFKQGIGRLVRRDGLRDRRLVIGDPRIEKIRLFRALIQPTTTQN